MVPYLKINSRCVACDNCKLLCPEKAILRIKNEYIVEVWACTLCQVCVEICPVNAIKFINDPSVSAEEHG